MNRLYCLALFACISFSIAAQDSRKPMTNDDVLSMTKAGLDEQTIVLAIEQGPSNFDTSPQALVTLKRSGVSDAALNAMLSASKKAQFESVSPTPASSSAINAANSPEAVRLAEKAFAAISTADKLASIKATRPVGASTMPQSTTITVNSRWRRSLGLPKAGRSLPRGTMTAVARSSMGHMRD